MTIRDALTLLVDDVSDKLELELYNQGVDLDTNIDDALNKRMNNVTPPHIVSFVVMTKISWDISKEESDFWYDVCIHTDKYIKQRINPLKFIKKYTFTKNQDIY